jgi:hypothetical protein
MPVIGIDRIMPGFETAVIEMLPQNVSEAIKSGVTVLSQLPFDFDKRLIAAIWVIKPYESRFRNFIKALRREARNPRRSSS